MRLQLVHRGWTTPRLEVALAIEAHPSRVLLPLGYESLPEAVDHYLRVGADAFWGEVQEWTNP